jgi:hypothetical protein
MCSQLSRMSVFGHYRLYHDRVKQASALERVTMLYKECGLDSISDCRIADQIKRLIVGIPERQVFRGQYFSLFIKLRT